VPVADAGGAMDRIRSIIYGQLGQTTTEYATTLIVVLLVTGALAAFVKGGGLDSFFKDIVKALSDKARP
jgi:hypothetical protein